MPATVSVGSPRIDKVLYDFVTDEAMPGTGFDAADPFGPGSPRWCSVWRREMPRCCSGATSCRRRSMLWHRQHPGRPSITRATRRSCSRSAIWCPSRSRFAVDTADVDPEIAAHRRPAIGGAGQQRALCPECRQCALGQPLRCALRHRRHPGGRRAARRASTIRSAARRSSPSPGISWTSTLRSPMARITMPSATASPARGLEVQLENGGSASPARPRRFRGFQGDAGIALARLLLVHHGLHVELHIDRDALHRPRRSRRHQRCACWNPRSRPFKIARIRLPRSMPTIRCKSIETGWD